MNDATQFFNTVAGAGGYEIERSLRFNAPDSAYLNRTPGSAGNQQTWTWSAWVKRSTLGVNARLFDAYTTSTDTGYLLLGFSSADKLIISGWSTNWKITTQVFRDCSAWYHVCVVFDVTQSTGGNRIKFYINGTQVTTYDTDVAPSQNTNHAINGAYAHQIGRYSPSPSQYFDGYLADVHFVDGQALDPTSFGEFDDNGVWQPKAYSGSRGTNGFHLDFSDNSSAAALGTDTSGNGNDWDVYNIQASSSGQVYSSMLSGSVKTATAGFTAPFNVGRSEGTGGLTFTPTTPIPYSSSVEIYDNNNVTKAQVNGGSFVQMVTNSWVTVASGSGTITSIYSVRTDSPSYDAGWQAIRVDGSILYDANLAGVDSLVDSPTNGSQEDTGVGGELAGNYATLNPLDSNTGTATFSEGNLKIVTPTNSAGVYVSTIATPTTGKWYTEATMVALSNNVISRVGLVQVGQPRNTSQLGNDPGQIAYRVEVGDIRYNLTTLATGGSPASNGDIIGIALDQDNQTLTIYKNGVLQVTATSIPQFNWFFAGSDDYTAYSATHEWNFGQRPFAYTAPSGFKALCTTNLPTPTIADGSTAMDVALYTGNGSGQTISGLNFSPDFVWIKSRSNAYGHANFDIIRGATKYLSSNQTLAEATETQTLTAFNSDGFALGNDAAVNGSGATYAAWTWDAGSSTVTNTQGSITSQVRANASAGFSVVTYTGTGSNATVGHGLGVAPQMLIVKSRSNSENWGVYHQSVGNTAFLKLDTTGGTASFNAWASTTPTSTVFSVGNIGETNTNGGTYVCYAFAPVAGYSSFGSYTGNGSADGPFVYTGFRPRYLLIKHSSSGSDPWIVRDTARDPYNSGTSAKLAPNYSYEENNSTYLGLANQTLVDFTSNGFKVRSTGNFSNASGETYIYAAFAEHPFAYARAR